MISCNYSIGKPQMEYLKGERYNVLAMYMYINTKYCLSWIMDLRETVQAVSMSVSIYPSLPVGSEAVGEDINFILFPLRRG